MIGKKPVIKEPALLTGFLLHSKFMAPGGPNPYVARE
jgi:hypothetical protein